jgi:dTDP-4-dehydrorhamnose reductase
VAAGGAGTSRIAIVGAGFCGTRLAALVPGAELARVDVTDGAAVARVLESAPWDAVVNAAGKTGRPNVDWCEAHREETRRVNVDGARIVAEACAARGTYLVHLGSGCVFGGPSPREGGFREDDAPNPSSYYAETKLAADLALADAPSVAILRVRMLVDRVPSPRNLITRLAGYAEVADVVNSMTAVEDLARVVARVVDLRPRGVLHATNPGVLSHRALVAMYTEAVDPAHRCAFVPEAELLARGLVVRRRSTCVLATPRLDALGITRRAIDEAARAAMRGYREALGASHASSDAKNAT